MIIKHKLLFVVIALFGITGCAHELINNALWTQYKSKQLLDHLTPVPANSKVYGKRTNLDSTLLKMIDVNVVYEQFNTTLGIVSRLQSTEISKSWYGVVRFYPNGRLNLFFVKHSSETNSDFTVLDDLNPEFKGYRGVYYMDKGTIRYYYFSAINEFNDLGKISGTIEVHGDTIVMKTKEHSATSIKRTLPADFMQFKANW